MTRSVKILIAVAAVIFAVSAVLTFIFFRDRKTDGESVMVEILQDNKVIYTLDLAKEEDRTFRIESADGGWNDVTIEDGQISITDADCSDRTCVKTGRLRSEYVPIICLPHKLVIRYADGEDE